MAHCMSPCFPSRLWVSGAMWLFSMSMTSSSPISLMWDICFLTVYFFWISNDSPNPYWSYLPARVIQIHPLPFLSHIISSSKPSLPLPSTTPFHIKVKGLFQITNLSTSPKSNRFSLLFFPFYYSIVHIFIGKNSSFSLKSSVLQNFCWMKSSYQCYKVIYAWTVFFFLYF